ncbi:18S rRNA (guanine1575-N7)-methyltransferase [Saitoella coloradoensis]
MSRPEHIAPPEIFYNDDEAQKYTQNSRVQSIQAEMTLRAIDLLSLPDSPSFLLDIGCGSCLSGEILSEEGHIWCGLDIAPSMLQVALERDVEGDLFLQDIGDGIPFRAGTFDGAISISVIQWLCNADKAANAPGVRLRRFFETLYASLRRGGRAVCQFYPESESQTALIMQIATKCGFGGGLVVDYPDSKKARKYYLCLVAGQSDAPVALPQALTGEGEEKSGVKYEGRRGAGGAIRNRDKKKKGKAEQGSREWVMQKKELYRKRGKADVPRDSKYSTRKRKVRF